MLFGKNQSMNDLGRKLDPGSVVIQELTSQFSFIDVELINLVFFSAVVLHLG